MLKRDDTALVVIDMQEKLMPAMNSGGQAAKKAAMLIRGAGILGIPHIFTQQYTKGLGETVSEVRDAAGPDFSYIEKTSFSACGEEEFKAELKKTGRNKIVICGVETHVCVMQTVLDLISADNEVYIVADCVSSRFESDEIISLERMKEAGAVVTTAEAVLFELLKGSKEQGFKEISKLVK